MNGQLIVDQVNINGNQIQPNTADTNLKINGNGTGVVEVTENMSVTGTVDVEMYQLMVQNLTELLRCNKYSSTLLHFKYTSC